MQEERLPTALSPALSPLGTIPFSSSYFSFSFSFALSPRENFFTRSPPSPLFYWNPPPSLFETHVCMMVIFAKLGLFSET